MNPATRPAHTPEARLREMLSAALDAAAARELPSALAMAERALAYAQREFGADHALVVLPLSTLCGICNDLGEYPRAEVFARQAIGRLIEVNQGDTMQATLLRANLALALARQGKSDGVVSLCEAVLNDVRAHLTARNPHAVQVFNQLALAMLAAGHHATADQLMQVVIGAIRRGIVLPTLRLHHALFNRGIIHLHAGNMARALTHLEEACDEAAREPTAHVDDLVRIHLACARAAALGNDDGALQAHVRAGYALARRYPGDVARETQRDIQSLAEDLRLTAQTIRFAS